MVDKEVEAMGDIEDRKAVEPLISALTDPDWQIRKKAAWALGEMKDFPNKSKKWPSRKYWN